MYLRVSMTIDGASALNSYYVYGHFAPFTIPQFVHALGQRADIPVHDAALVVIHDFQLRAHRQGPNRVSFPLPLSTERDRRGRTQVDIPRSDFELSLIIPLTEFSEAIPDRVNAILPRLRFAGGMIRDDFQTAVADFDELLGYGPTSQTRVRVPVGRVMRPEPLPASEDPAHTLVTTTANREEGSGWITPSLVGYRLAEAPRDRPGSRFGHPHAYADPLIGAVRFDSIREATKDDFWYLQRQGPAIIAQTDAASPLTGKRTADETESQTVQ